MANDHIQKCQFCTNKIDVLSDFVVSCLNCPSKACVVCGQEMIKYYGNRVYIASSMFSNYCYSENCDPFENMSDPECNDSSEEENELLNQSLNEVDKMTLDSDSESEEEISHVYEQLHS